MTTEPRREAEREAREPWNPPMGVRRAATTQTSEKRPPPADGEGDDGEEEEIDDDGDGDEEEDGAEEDGWQWRRRMTAAEGILRVSPGPRLHIKREHRNRYNLQDHLQALQGLDDGVVPWVSQVLEEVIKRTLSSKIVLDHKPKKCQHG